MRAPSKIASAVQASTTLAIDSLFKKMKADGIDVIGFGAGEPDYATPDNIKKAACRAIDENFTKYTPAAGIEELRRAVCARLLADCGLEYEPSQILVSSGAKHNVFLALMSLLDPGDEVILPAPYWVSYLELIRMAAGVPVVVASEESAGFKVTPRQLRAAAGAKTKALILNNPSNPTGMLYTRPELEAIAEACRELDLYVIADEIYYKLIYDGREFTSFAALGADARERTILINGVSKSYAMTGWRIGYAAARPEAARIMANYQSHSTGAPSSISQMAAVEALCGPQEGIEDMRREFEKRRDYLYERMNSIGGVSCIKPDGAFYIMMNCEALRGREIGGKLINDGDDFASVFLEKGLVATVPCSGFGAPDFVRWSYATSMENIEKGLDRLEALLK